MPKQLYECFKNERIVAGMTFEEISKKAMENYDDIS
jgi:hypothetical protein